MSFRYKTLLGVAVIEAVFLTLLVWNSVRFMTSAAERELIQRAYATVNRLTVTLSSTATAHDSSVLQTLLQEALRNPDLVYARVRDQSQRVIASVGDEAVLARPFVADTALTTVSDQIFDTTGAITLSGSALGQIAGDPVSSGQVGMSQVEVGQVDIGLSVRTLHQRIAEVWRFSSILAVLQIGLVALFLLFMLNRYWTRPLQHLADAARRIAAGAFGYQIPIPVLGRNEPADTVGAFNRMSLGLQEACTSLSEREHHLGQMLENIQDGIVTMDRSGCISSLNPAAEAIFGLSAAAVGTHVQQLFTAGGWDKIQSLFGAAPEPKHLGRLHETEGCRANGQPFPLEICVTLLGAGPKTAASAIAVMRDLTTRVAAEAEQRLRERIIEDSLHGVVILDANRPERPITYANQGFARITGYAIEEVLGKSSDFLHGPKTDPTLLDRIQTALNEGAPINEVVINYTKEGREFYNDLAITPIRDSEGYITDFVALHNDITERKRIENALREAKEAAEAAAATKTQFLANMSHEIRTPLHGVLGALEILRDTPLSLLQKRYLDTANTSADTLLTLIDEVLDFSRLEAGKLRIESLDFDLRRTVEDVTAMFSQRAHTKHLELACFIAPGVPDRVKGDPIRLRQVLVNLLGNAIKFTDHGEVVVNVALEPAEAKPPLFRFEVRDTGVGIAADKQPLLFQPFVQADGGHRRRFGGTGLGLSIARRLVELMGGRIGLESQAGLGSRFWFYLPFATAARAPSSARASFTEARMLVVDDNATNRIILHRYLTAWGVQPDSAANGEEALAKLHDSAAAGRPYQLALLDFHMPDMDGLMLAKRLRQDSALAGIRLLMLSSAGRDDTCLKDSGIDVWLNKPVRQSDLYDAIATLLNARNSYLAAPEPPSFRHRAELHFAGESVLLVEDNLTTQQVGEAMLRQRGLAVDIANNGLEAVAALERKRYAIVLMDVQMPELDGYEATRRVRAQESATGKARTPIIALTAHALPTDRQQCLEAGMDDYLVKPYSGAALSAMIARWLAPPGQAHPDDQTEGLPLFDLVKFTEVKTLMGPHFEALLVTFMNSVRSQLDAVVQAHAHQDREAFLDAVHRLKNTAGDIGASRLRELAATLESAIKRGELPLDAISPLEQAGWDTVAAAEKLQEQGNPL